MTKAKNQLAMLFLFWLPWSVLAQQGDQLFNTSVVHELRIHFAIDDYRDSLSSEYEKYNTFSGSDIPYLQASIVIDGTSLDSVGIRYKGKSSYYFVNEKKPIKIDFNEFVDDQEYDGLKKINLHNAIGDPGMLRDLLCYDMMRAAGVPAPRVSFCRVFFNDEYAGVYKIIEQIDKTFLKNNFANGDGNLYKNQRWSNLDWWGADPAVYQDTFELKTNVDEGDWSDFIHFLDVLNNSTEEEFPQAIEEVFNVDQYLHVLAIDLMSNNWDSYISNRRNWYLYHEPESGQFQWIPWDYNLALGGKLSTSGNPYPPFDQNCPIQTSFEAVTDGLTVHFSEFSSPSASSWFWDFGDGNSSSEQHPSYTFSAPEKTKVCLTARRENNGNTCEQTRCQIVDLSFDPAACNSIQNGTSPYPATDPVFQMVIAEDEHCCSGDWDVFCEISYQEFSSNPPKEISSGIDYQTDFPLLLDNPDKILIDRLLRVPAYRDRYLDICCLIRSLFFAEEKIFPKIDFYAGLLREPIFYDPFYNYTSDYFAYDVGNGTGGGSEAKIPALKHFFNQRFPQIDEDLANAQQDCSTIASPIGWQDVVINEFMAANTPEGGIPDSEGEFDDWIELYNNTNAPIDLSGFYLSDNSDHPKQWPFPRNTIIPAHDYLIVWADKDPGEAGLHANFKLSKSGDHILLAHEDETWIDYISFAAQSENIASARIPNGTGPFLQQAATFNRDNTTVGSQDLSSATQGLNIYPNPASSEIFIALKNQSLSEKGQLQICNSMGATVFTQDLPLNHQWHYDLKHLSLPTGIYFIKIDLSHQSILQRIFIEL